MSASSTVIAAPRYAGDHSRLVGGAVLLLGAATVVTTLASNGHPIGALAPALLAAIGWAVWSWPLRTTLTLVMLLGLSVDRPGDADGRWASPLVSLGGLIFHNLNHIVPLDALKFSGLFALLAVLLVVRAARLLGGRTRDTAGSLTLAAPMRLALLVAVATLLGCTAFGALRGGDIQSAKVQIQGYLQLLAVAYLFGVSLRGERDYRLLGGVIVVAACVKAIMALWVRATLPATFPDRFGVPRELEYATNHGDSLVFACAFAVLLGPLFHEPTRRQMLRFLLLTPLIVAGVVANDRRIAWVQLALVAAAFFLLNPASVPARRLRRLVAVTAPVWLLYVAVGWTSSSRIFAPVGFVRNLVQAERTDGSLDRSTLFRDVENFNLVATFLPNPVLGTGFGHPFVEAVVADDLSEFVDYFFLPHNSVLGLWAFTGAVGFTGLMGAVSIGLLLAARAHPRASTAAQAMAAAAVVGCLASYVVHLWADIGFTEAPAILLVGTALAVAGQLGVSTGEWPGRS